MYVKWIEMHSPGKHPEANERMWPSAPESSRIGARKFPYLKNFKHHLKLKIDK